MTSPEVLLVDLQGDPSPFPIPWRVSVMMFFMTWGEYILYNLLPAVAIALFFLVVAWITAKFILLLLTRAGVRPREADAVAFAFTAVIILYGCFMTLSFLGINYQLIIYSMGLGTMAVSYTCATTLINLFSGILNKYYDIVETNYCIEVNGKRGVVEECGLLVFLLWNYDTRHHIYIPNSAIFNGSVTYLNKEESRTVAGPDRIVNVYATPYNSVIWKQHEMADPVRNRTQRRGRVQKTHDAVDDDKLVFV